MLNETIFKSRRMTNVEILLVFVLYLSIHCLSFGQQDSFKPDPRCVDPWTSEWTRDSSDCRTVYFCVWGKAIQTHHCNGSRIWSNFGHACVEPMSQWDDCNQTPTTPTLNDPRCINPDGINPDPDNCAQFLACTNRTVIAVMKCPANTLFSVANNNTCALGFMVANECKGRNIPVDIDISTPTPIIDQPCVVIKNGDVPDRENCHRFYKCNHGRVVARIRCPRGSAFSISRNKCDWLSAVLCNKRTANQRSH